MQEADSDEYALSVVLGLLYEHNNICQNIGCYFKSNTSKWEINKLELNKKK